MPKLLGFTQSAFDPASRFRFIQLVPHLEGAGWKVEHRPNRPDRQWTSSRRSRWLRALHYRMGRIAMKVNRLRDALEADHYDTIFVNRDFMSEGPLSQKIFSPLMSKVVFDFDDAIFVGPKEKVVRWMCARSAWVTPGNQYLADYARQFTDRVTIIPTIIDTEKCVARSYGQSPRPGPIRIGWSGSDQSVGATLVPHLEMLARLQAEVDFELVVVTNSKPELPIPNLRWRFHPWKQEEEAFLESKFDIGIMPLVNNSFQKGKCALKLLQYMAAGLPTVASPVGVNTEVVQHGQTGMLAATDTEWHAALKLLLENKLARAAMGMAGREVCERDYSIRRWLPVVSDIFQKVADGNRERPGFSSLPSGGLQPTSRAPERVGRA